MKYKLIACGGTFDLFHKGHQDFLLFGVQNSEKLMIGLTSDLYLDNHKDHITAESFEIRKQNIERFFREAGIDNYEIVKIDDPYGPSIEKGYDFDAILVTTETQKGGEAINPKREGLGLKPLEIITFEMTKGEDGKEISSTRIRNGEIDRHGNLYIKHEWFDKVFSLTPHLREVLRRPFGELIKDFENWKQTTKINPSEIITVGDETTHNFVNSGITPALSIIDFKIKRKPILEDMQDRELHDRRLTKIANPPGVICGELIKTIHEGFTTIQKPQTIVIDGEDDLAVIPVILSAPLGYSVFYGQPDEGLVQVEVTEETKDRVKTLFQEFEPI